MAGAPENLIVDRGELEAFIAWLPELEAHEAYLVQLMIRGRGLKEVYGFKGSDHVLAFKAVHGYLSAETPEGARYWRVRLENEIMRLGLLAARAEWEYANYEPGGRERIRFLETVPWQLLAIYIHVNPADTVKALRETAKELVDALYGMARARGLESYQAFFRRPDQRYYANLARSTKTRFHVVDADTRELYEQALEMFQETFGYLPARIIMHRGGHLLIDLADIAARGKTRLYASRMDPETQALLNQYRSMKRSSKTDPARLEEARKRLLAYARDPRNPYFHRVRVLSTLYRDEKDAPLIEVKKQALEPVPGMLYKGAVVVRFKPEEA